MDVARCTLVTLALSLVVAVPAAAQDRPPYRVFAFGDSYGSGEGAPGTPGIYSLSGAEVLQRAVWSGTATDRAFTGDTELGVMGARRCHRSPHATAPRAAKILQNRFPLIAVSFRSFACSGAQINTGVRRSYKGIEEDDATNADDDDPKVPSQISQLNDHLATLPSSSGIDALVMNIGGNNLGFAKLIQTCVELPVGEDPCSPITASDSGGNDNAKDLFEKGRDSGEPAGEIGLDFLAGHFANLAADIGGPAGAPAVLAKRPRSVALTAPPNVLAGGFAGCAELDGPYDYENRLRSDERRWLEEDVLARMVSAMGDAATTHRWDFVDTRRAFADGICGAFPRGINQNQEALPKMGDLGARFGAIQVSSGWVHPTPAGFAAMAPLLADAMQPRLIQRFTPAERPLATPVELFTLGPRVQLRYVPPRADFPLRPSARLHPGLTEQVGPLGATLLELRTTTAEHVQRTVSTRATTCGPVGFGEGGFVRGCGPGADVPMVTGTPGTPPAPRVVRTASDTLRVSWTPSPTAPPLRRFVVEVARVAPTDAGGNGSLTDPACAFTSTGTSFGEPSPTRSGCVSGASGTLPPMRYSMGATLRSALVPSGIGNPRVRVYECTDRGCGAGSASTLAPTTITPTLTTPTPLQLRQVPLGVVGAQVKPTVRSGLPTTLVVGWRAWKGWRNLRSITVQLRDAKAGALATLRLSPKTGRVVLAGRGARARTTATTGRRTVTSGPIRFDARRAKLWRTKGSAAFTLPITLRGRGDVEVAVGATSVRGKAQPPRAAARFALRR